MEHETGGPHSARPVRAIPAGGPWNTLFGYGSFAFFTAILSPVIPHSYIVASVISSLLNISVSFFGYKWFVFKTKGNYRAGMDPLRRGVQRRHSLRRAGFPVLVALIRHNTRFFTQAPYIAGALLTAFMVVYSFVGHKNFSFRTPA
jgi:putative flippase GtrA